MWTANRLSSWPTFVVALLGVVVGASLVAAQAAAPTTGQTSPAMNPAYLAEMPSVDRVKREIQGANPDDTLARQVAVFTMLPQIVKRRMDPNRSVRQPMTPDEQRVIAAYDLAAYELSQAFAKTHTPQEAAAFAKTHGRYEMDPAFYEQWFNLLFTPAFRAGFGQVQAANSAQAQARVDAQRREFENAQAPRAQQNAATAKTGAAKPGSQEELRRCIASGRSMRLCFSASLSNGMDELTGLGSLKPPVAPGLRMTGDYSSPEGFRVIFQPDKATMLCRGVPAPLLYAVEVTATQTLVRIQNGTTPVIFSIRADGKLAGSGPIRITGQVPAGSTTEQTSGMTTQTTTRQRELTPLEAKQYQNAKQNGQVFMTTEETTELLYGPTGSRTVTAYTTKTAECTLGLMTGTGPTPLPPDTENPMGLLTAILSGSAVLMKGGSAEAALKDALSLDTAPAPGLRMRGRYVGQGGFSVTFHDESATIACGDAERAHPYAVQRSGNQIQIRIQEQGNPVTLQLRPDGTLFGEGAAQVNGRIITGTTDDPDNLFIYAPKVGRCAVGALTPAGR